MRRKFVAALLLVAVVLVAGCQSPPKMTESAGPLIIAHRGASGHLPEHTLPAFELAIKSAADFIEPDLVLTKDGVFIVRHENELSLTTDVAEKFPKRKTTKIIDGKSMEGWFSEEFTWEEIQRLRAKQRFPFRDQSYNGQFKIPRLEEILDLAKSERTLDGKPIGIYPELKQAEHFRKLGLTPEESLLKILESRGFKSAEDPVFIQSFEPSALKRLRPLTKLRLVQLTWDQNLSEEALREIRTYANGVGPNKLQLRDGAGFSRALKIAKSLGLSVHPYTFRSDPSMLPTSYKDPLAEYEDYFSAGVDGVFTDFPEDAAKARAAWRSKAR